MDRPAASSEAVRRRMRQQARRDTEPELALRRELWRRGLRYRVDVAPIAGLRRRADLVFTRGGVVVFVDGCFWHSCPEHSTVPKASRDWWINKLETNVRRDRDTDVRLGAAGWKVIRAWEHEPAAEVADRIVGSLKDRSRLR